MKSAEVYKVIREVVGPWCKAQGFKRTAGGMLGWHRPLADKHTVFWFQCSQDGWDQYAGSKFVVEFQLSSTPVIGGDGPRNRLPHFLSTEELEEIRAIQNAVVGRLPQPPRDYFAFGIDASTAEWYRAKFRAVREPYTNQDDIWLRYHQPADVRRWAEFVLSILPKALSVIGRTPARCNGGGARGGALRSRPGAAVPPPES